MNSAYRLRPRRNDRWSDRWSASSTRYGPIRRTTTTPDSRPACSTPGEARRIFEQLSDPEALIGRRWRRCSLSSPADGRTPHLWNVPFIQYVLLSDTCETWLRREW